MARPGSLCTTASPAGTSTSSTETDTSGLTWSDVVSKAEAIGTAIQPLVLLLTAIVQAATVWRMV